MASIVMGGGNDDFDKDLSLDKDFDFDADVDVDADLDADVDRPSLVKSLTERAASVPVACGFGLLHWPALECRCNHDRIGHKRLSSSTHFCGHEIGLGWMIAYVFHRLKQDTVSSTACQSSRRPALLPIWKSPKVNQTVAQDRKY